MKKILLLLFVLSIAKFGLTQPCANSANIYAFTFGGKNYEVVKEMKTWAQAAACAVQRGGHLVHIDTVTEQNAVYNAIIVGAGVPSNYTSVNDGGGAAYVWIGATDKNVEGTWLWDGDGDNIGTTFWTGQGAAGANNGVVVGNAFVNWGGASSGPYNEPDNYLNLQDGGGMALSSWPYGIPSEWNDINPANTLYYVIEYETSSGIYDPKQNEAKLDIFPNPSSSEITVMNLSVSGNGSMVRIFSADGKKVSEVFSDRNETKLSVQELAPGVYFVEVVNSDRSMLHSRFIKQ